MKEFAGWSRLLDEGGGWLKEVTGWRGGRVNTLLRRRNVFGMGGGTTN